MMTAHSRQTKVLVVLLVSIVLCTIILNVLGHNPPSAGAFCLSQYYSLVPVEEVIRSRQVQRVGYFQRIEIYYGKDSSNGVVLGSNIKIGQSGSLCGVSGREDIDCHFIIYNGRNHLDGEIVPTEKWKKQLPVGHRPDDNVQRPWKYEQTIYICILVDGQMAQPTDSQIKRLHVLVEELCRELNIESESVLYPDNWQC